MEFNSLKYISGITTIAKISNFASVEAWDLTLQDKLQKDVYGLGYPSLPVLSVAEYQAFL